MTLPPALGGTNTSPGYAASRCLSRDDLEWNGEYGLERVYAT